MTVSWYGRTRCAVGRPVEERVDHDAGHGVAERVDPRRVRGVGGIDLGGLQVVGEQRLGEVEVAVERLAVRVEQQLAGVASVARRRIPRAVHPEAVALARGDRRQVGVPDVAVDLVEVDPFLGAVLGDQAQLDLLGDLGEQREVRARAVVGGAERIRSTGPHRRRGHQSTLSAAAAGCAAVTTSRWRPRSGARAHWSSCACRSSRCGENRGRSTRFPPPRGTVLCGTPRRSCRAASSIGNRSTTSRVGLWSVSTSERLMPHEMASPPSARQSAGKNGLLLAHQPRRVPHRQDRDVVVRQLLPDADVGARHHVAGLDVPRPGRRW